MNKLFKYMDKIGADYHAEKIGYSYFYNVAPVVRDCAIVCFDYRGSKCEVAKEMQREKMIERYAARYGYKVYNKGGALGCSWFTVASEKDFEDVSYMGEYVQRSVSACEKLIHLYRSGKTVYKTDSELNDALRAIMDHVGREYKRMTFLVFGVAV